MQQHLLVAAATVELSPAFQSRESSRIGFSRGSDCWHRAAKSTVAAATGDWSADGPGFEKPG